MKGPAYRSTAFLLIFLLAAPLVTGQRTKSSLGGFSNPTAITINTTSGVTAPTVATLYPSTIEVTGMTGTITRLTVTLDGINHTRPDNLDFLLVAPSGEKYIFLSDAMGSTFDLNDKRYTFADDAATTLPTFKPPSGTYKPTNLNPADTFPAPAPAGPYNSAPGDTLASTFNGISPNGTWSLYAVDDSVFAPGSVNSGWSLTITTGGAPATFANSAYIGLNDYLAPSDPYGTAVSVSGLAGVITDVNVTIDGFSHGAPRDVDVLLVSPNGRGVVLMSDVNTSMPADNADLTFDDAAPGILSNVVTGVYRPTDNVSESSDTFPSPAPLRPYHANNGLNSLSKFNGLSPNGEWRLYVVDDSPDAGGSIAGGWGLEITTAPAAPPPPAVCTSPGFSPTAFTAGTGPTNMVLEDFNGDMRTDLAVTNQISNNVSVLLGNGDGTFAPQMLFAAGSSPYSVAAGRFNADEHVDLAVANSGSNNVSVLLGNGDGTFSTPTDFLVGASPLSIAAGDFNNDSETDLAVANFGSFFAGTVSILLGNGAGGFSSGGSVRTRTQPAFVAVARLDADANDDLVVANFGADSVSTFFGNGAGGFRLSQNLPTGHGPVAVELADLGSDGIADLSVANYNADSITICSGTAAGTFTGCGLNNPAGGANPVSITTADFVGNGQRTNAVALSGSDIVRVLTNSVAVGQGPNDVEAADLNADGLTDLVSVNFGSNDVSVLLNACQVAVGNLFDYNNDQRTDYAVFRPGIEGYYVNSLNQSGVAVTFGRPDDRLVPADYDGDRMTDFGFYRPGNGLWHIVDRFGRPIYFIQFGLPEDIPAPADYDGDGKTDIAVFRPSNGTWYIRRSSDNAVLIRQFGMDGDKPSAADFDGDGQADIAVYRPSTGVWYIWRSSDEQFFITQFGIAEDKTVVADYDGDKKADIAVWRPSTGVWYVLKSSDGGFIISSFGMSGDLPVVGDFDQDGRYDFAVWRPSDGTWYVLKSSDGGTIFFSWGMAGDLPIPNAYVR